MNAIWKKPITHLSRSIHLSEHDSHIPTLCGLGRLKEALHAIRCNPLPFPSSTNSSLLQLCINTNAPAEGRSLHDHLLTTGYAPDLHLNTKFTIFYMEFGDVRTARKVFDEILERNIVSWIAMISGYSQDGYPLEALEVFYLMCRSVLKPNQYTYGSVLKVCINLGCIRNGEQIHGSVSKSRFVEDLFVGSALVDLHLKCGSVESARHLFGRMERRDVVSWNSLIGGHAVRGLRGDAFGLFCKMLRDGKKWNLYK